MKAEPCLLFWCARAAKLERTKYNYPKHRRRHGIWVGMPSGCWERGVSLIFLPHSTNSIGSVGCKIKICPQIVCLAAFEVTFKAHMRYLNVLSDCRRISTLLMNCGVCVRLFQIWVASANVNTQFIDCVDGLGISDLDVFRLSSLRRWHASIRLVSACCCGYTFIAGHGMCWWHCDLDEIK